MIDRRREEAIAILLSLARMVAREDAAATGGSSSAKSACGQMTGLTDALEAHGIERPDDVRDGPAGQILIWRKLYLALAPTAEAPALREKGFEVVIYSPGEVINVAALAERLRLMVAGAA